jgi:hypothetical protein
MNMYTKLSMHLSRYMYKRGANKGDAPANRYRRGMTHFRVVKGNDDTYRVRMFGTDLLTAKPDGTVVIDTGGWYDRPTTILRLNEAFGFFDGVSISMYKQSILSYSQPVLRVNGKRYSYYDGITLNEQGEILTELRAFEMKRVDRVATKELADDLAESGFKNSYALLYAVSTPEDMALDSYAYFGLKIPEALADATQGDAWKTIIARHKFHRSYSYNGYQYEERSNAKQVWANLMAECKKNMYIVSRSETYVL